MRPKRVALLIETSSSWGSQIIAGISDYIRKHERWILYLDHRGFYERQNVPTWWEGDGIIGRVLSPALAQYARLGKVPCVNVSQVRVPGADIQQVTSDELAIGKIAADVLINTGLKHFAYYGPPKRDHYVDQIGATFRAAVEPIGTLASIEPDRLLRTDTNPHFNLQQLADWIGGLPKPCGVLAWNAMGAFRVLEAAAWAGIAVPDDLSVLAGEVDELLITISNPTLAVVDHNAFQVGYRAAEELARLMEGGQPGEPIYATPVGYRPGESVLLPADRDPVVARARQWLKARLTESTDVPTLAAAVGVSRRTLELRFRKATGDAPAAELRRLRVEAACKMLKETDRPIRDIATACGFTAVELLQRAMHRLVGKTPTEYRAAERK